MNEESYALSVERLGVAYHVRARDVAALRDVSFCIRPGESYGLVGESGCGKTTVALAIVRYLAANGRIVDGRILVAGRDVHALGAEELRQLRSTTVSMVYQDPSRALNPSIRVGDQIAEIFREQGQSWAVARAAAADVLERVRIADRNSVMRRYPHQLSGGMQQRVVIAMALATGPRLLILDEPTTGLDATVELEILGLIQRLRTESATSILFISHNLALISRMCDRTGILYSGLLVEEGPTREVLGAPRHPYTAGLLRCVPRRGNAKNRHRLDTIPGLPPAPGDDMPGCLFAPRCALADDRCHKQAPEWRQTGSHGSRCHYVERVPALPRAEPAAMPATTGVDRAQRPILSVAGVSKTFRSAGHAIRVLHEVSLAVWPGETLGLVGESGSGKTTLARLLLGLVAPDTGGEIELKGEPLPAACESRRSDQLQSLQIIFQNPDSALNRAHSVRRLIKRALIRLGRVPKSQRATRLKELTQWVRLDSRYLDRHPRELSGGLRQRVAIARAFAGAPSVVVCDEPTSALDVSVQSAILNLLADLQSSLGVSYLFISHDLNSVRYLSDRIAVLYLGRLMEVGPAERVFSGPHHPYTAALLSAVPTLDGNENERERLTGEIPSAMNAPSGCAFHTRCPRKLGPICELQEPPLHYGGEPGHAIRCHIPTADLPARERASGGSQ
jgi:peptide/nickel transport system ATP-binding protein